MLHFYLEKYHTKIVLQLEKMRQTIYHIELSMIYSINILFKSNSNKEVEELHTMFVILATSKTKQQQF